MQRILDISLDPRQAALWFLGQSGFLIQTADTRVVIDPYLSDSVAEVSPKLTRLYPPPIRPETLKADLFIVTHDHLDHLDPHTIEAYRFKETTAFIGPRLACKKLRQLGIPEKNMISLDSGQQKEVSGVELTGIYAVPTEPAVIDSIGCRLRFSNGRSVYHSGDTGYSDLLLRCAPSAEAALVCINGRWGNLNVEQAAALIAKVNPRYAVPHHYDLMKLSLEDPEAFEYQVHCDGPGIEVKILNVMEPFIWQ